MPFNFGLTFFKNFRYRLKEILFKKHHQQKQVENLEDNRPWRDGYKLLNFHWKSLLSMALF